MISPMQIALAKECVTAGKVSRHLANDGSDVLCDLSYSINRHFILSVG